MDKILLAGLAASVAGACLTAGPPAPLPNSAVDGVEIPRTQLALRAEAYVRAAEPDFLFNHSVRTFVFGALSLKARGITYDPETAYVAALFHDAGLVPQLSSKHSSFEVDGANAAESFVKENGGSAEQGRRVWNAIVMHDMPSPYKLHQSPEAVLLGAGAGADVDGVDPATIGQDAVTHVLAKFPRLHFKTRFTALASDHCKRKPTSQIGWLDVLCREVVPNADRGSVREEIQSAPFAE